MQLEILNAIILVNIVSVEEGTILNNYENNFDQFLTVQKTCGQDHKNVQIYQKFTSWTTYVFEPMQ